MEYIFNENCVIIRQPESFGLSETLECGQCFRFEKLDDEDYDVIAFGKVVNLKQRDGSIIIDGIGREEFEKNWKHYFDLDRSYEKIKESLSKNDEIMKEAVRFAPGIRILNQDFFECLISFIISQNNRIPMIKKVITNISEKYGDLICVKNGIKYYAFPTPKQLEGATVESLMGCKTGFRAKYIADAVKKYNEGLFDKEEMSKMPVEEARKLLMTIKGVGPKVADCVLFFSLEKTDVFPADVWIKRVMEHFYFNGEEASLKEIQALAKEKYGCLSGFAQQYLFNYARTLKIGTK